MESDDTPDVTSVARRPDHCPKCGEKVSMSEFEGRETPWCPECEIFLSPNPVAAVQVIVYDGNSVLLLDEPVPQNEGLLSLPGGFARYDEPPKKAVLRELKEESGLSAHPSDLKFLTTHHAEFEDGGIYFLTYTLERSITTGELVPEFEQGDASFHSVEEVLAMTNRTRASDRDRIEMAIGTGQ